MKNYDKLIGKKFEDQRYGNCHLHTVDFHFFTENIFQKDWETSKATMNP